MSSRWEAIARLAKGREAAARAALAQARAAQAAAREQARTAHPSGCTKDGTPQLVTAMLLDAADVAQQALEKAAALTDEIAAREDAWKAAAQAQKQVEHLCENEMKEASSRREKAYQREQEAWLNSRRATEEKT